MKIVFISSMLPSGHYSQVITSGLAAQKNIDLLVYADNNLKNQEIRGCGVVMAVWSKSPRYVVDILTQLFKDKPDVVHLQHEINMYGGLTTAALFPILVAIIRASGYKVVVTLHGTVAKKFIDKKFLRLFHKDNPLLSPWILTVFFEYTFKLVSYFANKIIAHTNMAKDILVRDYHLSPIKIFPIPMAIPVEKRSFTTKTNPFFFYFGYMVRRKGLGFIISGFKKFLKANPKTKFKLVLAGGTIPGQEAAFDEIVEEIKENHLKKRVEIRGFINQKEQDELYNAAYCVLIPAVVTIGSSGPLFHSDSYGKCVIASKIGLYLEDIKHLTTGILTPNDKWDQWMEYAVNHPQEIKRIEKNVDKKANIRSPQNIATQYYKLYREI